MVQIYNYFFGFEKRELHTTNNVAFILDQVTERYIQIRNSFFTWYHVKKETQLGNERYLPLVKSPLL